MTLSTICSLLLATPFAASLLELTIALLPLITKVGLRIVAFRQGMITPAASHAFERDLQELLREIGRVIVQWVYNHLETSDLSQAPDLVNFDHNVYRRRPASLRRGGIATLFGVISLWRIRYEPCDAGVGLTCIFPLEQRLGIVVGKASTALAHASACGRPSTRRKPYWPCCGKNMACSGRWPRFATWRPISAPPWHR